MHRVAGRQASRSGVLNIDVIQDVPVHNVQGVFQPELLKQKSSGSSLSLGHSLLFG